jgi:hypothetical protein
MPKVKCGDCACFEPFPGEYAYEGYCEGGCAWDSIYIGLNWRLNERKRDRLRYCKAFIPKKSVPTGPCERKL